MVVAGIVWTVAGVNILRIGIDCWAQVSGGFVLMLLGAVAVFAAFHYMVFSRMFHKHKRRISQKGDSNCLMGFFDARGWIIMAFMITLGVSIRRYELMPLWFIAPFYRAVVCIGADGHSFFVQQQVLEQKKCGVKCCRVRLFSRVCGAWRKRW